MSRAFFEVAAPFLAAGVLAPVDVHAVALVAPRFGEEDPVRILGLAFAARAPRVGHAGVDLGDVAASVDDELRGRVDDDEDAPLVWPDRAAWHEATLASPLVGPPEDAALRPFVRQPLGGGRELLLTRRMYREQERVAAALRARAGSPIEDAGAMARVEAALPRLFGGDAAGEAARAVRLAAGQRLAIVTGGPGTGKTFSISRLLAALFEAHAGDRPLDVRLAAPTGKAAVRMREALREAIAEGATPPLDVSPATRAALAGLEASTLHRLLGVRPDGSVRHGPGSPLAADVVVVDEVSMVDLALMRVLLEGVAPDARLVLLGDRDQLASVEAGSVLADLVGVGDAGPLASSVARFSRSRRFADAPDVALVAACLQSDPPAAVAALAPEARLARAVDVLARRATADDERWPDRVVWLGAPELDATGRRARPTEAQLDALAAPYVAGFDAPDREGRLAHVDGYASVLARALRAGRRSDRATSPALHREVLDALAATRVLAVHRRGPLGVAGLERALAERVRHAIDPERRDDAGPHWLGRPVIVTENAYDVGLMNGDVGVVLPVEGRLGRAAVFPADDAPEGLRVVPLARLPAHEGALAMTVHKAQGSQFDRVALVLAGRPSPIQTRELVYTAVTRAKRQVVWLGAELELRAALGHRVVRASGLEALLRGDAG